MRITIITFILSIARFLSPSDQEIKDNAEKECKDESKLVQRGFCELGSILTQCRTYKYLPLMCDRFKKLDEETK